MSCGTYPGPEVIHKRLQMSIFNILAFVALAAVTPMVQAKPPCPGNVDSVRVGLIRDGQIIVPVIINETGPYDFLLDTGAQYTTVDLALAKALDLKIKGTTGVFGVGSFAQTPFTELELVRAGSETVERLMAVI